MLQRRPFNSKVLASQGSVPKLRIKINDFRCYLTFHTVDWLHHMSHTYIIGFPVWVVSSSSSIAKSAASRQIATNSAPENTPVTFLAAKLEIWKINMNWKNCKIKKQNADDMKNLHQHPHHIVFHHLFLDLKNFSTQFIWLPNINLPFYHHHPTLSEHVDMLRMRHQFGSSIKLWGLKFWNCCDCDNFVYGFYYHVNEGEIKSKITSNLVSLQSRT